ncbi:MAG: iron-sulfur cluster assembly scaffold protein [Clostridia bacterium]|nr:iron-sulfur cluster assembly scaffold protein [Candidatus Pelethousia sp.]NCB31292.1 iron-sulfur cluster assembly scaffold protein [Clostridia bacterium]
MSIGLFTDEVIDHFSNPRNAGALEDANGIGNAGDPHCGDSMTLYIKVEEDVVTDARFKISGCVAALASASVTTVLVKGKTVDQALKITNQDIADALGGLPEQKMHCSVLGEEAIQNAISDYRQNKMGRGCP